MCGTSGVGRLVGVSLVAALCGPGAPHEYRATIARLLAATTPTRQVQVDFDGDQVPDRGTIINPTHIRLSFARGGRDEVLTTPRALVGLVAADVNRDGAFDLVASLTDGSLIVWLNDGHGRLDRARPRPAPAGPAVSRSPLIRTGFALFTAIVVRDGLLGPASGPDGPRWAICRLGFPTAEGALLSLQAGRPGRAPPASGL